MTLKLYRKGLNLLVQWVFGILLWVWLSSKLENDGENVFHVMWLICIFTIVLDLWVLNGFMKTLGRQGVIL